MENAFAQIMTYNQDREVHSYPGESLGRLEDHVGPSAKPIAGKSIVPPRMIDG